MNRYNNTPSFINSKGKRFYGTVKYPSIPLDLNDTYVYTTVGDRFDILAQQYYSDSSLWWVVSTANEFLPQDSYFIPEGTQIRIPTNINKIINDFETLNRE
jgi:phage tail protein X